MNVLRFSFIAAATFVLALTACSQTDDLTIPPDLEPQFGTSGYDRVSDVAYSKALTLYTVGAFDGRSEFRYGVYVSHQNAFVRR